jgi:molybdate transport system substrate-binding protein
MLMLPRRPGRTGGNSWSAALAFSLLLIATGLSSGAMAADINVLTVRAFKPLLLDIARSFEASTGNTLTIASDSTGGVTARVIRGGEEFDLVVLPAEAMDSVAVQGKMMVDTVARVAKSGIGVVVKKGEPLPDINSVEAFKATMLAVPSFAYIDPESGSPDGTYLANLFDRLGIAAAIHRKAVLVPFGQVAARVDNGEAAMALQQINELQAVLGVTLVGPLPKELQFYTAYAAGVPVAARLPVAAKALLAFLRADAATRALAARGFERP